jgi:hypothetical protein
LTTPSEILMAGRIELHVRGSLGMVTYHVADDFLDHESYMRAAGVPIGVNQYPGFPDYPVDAFHDLAHDIKTFVMEFLIGDASAFRRAAPLAVQRRELVSRKEMARAAGDLAKREAARWRFKAGEYAQALALLEAMKYPELFSEAEQRTLASSRERSKDMDV